MKSIFGAIALLTAAPALAQAAPTPDAHAGHQGHTMPADHAEHGQADHDCKKCCEDAKKSGKPMDCVEGKKGAASPAASAPVDHAGHDH